KAVAPGPSVDGPHVSIHRPAEHDGMCPDRWTIRQGVPRAELLLEGKIERRRSLLSGRRHSVHPAACRCQDEPGPLDGSFAERKDWPGAFLGRDAQADVDPLSHAEGKAAAGNGSHRVPVNRDRLALEGPG